MSTIESFIGTILNRFPLSHPQQVTSYSPRMLLIGEGLMSSFSQDSTVKKNTNRPAKRWVEDFIGDLTLDASMLVCKFSGLKSLNLLCY